jgi:5-methyltetrahydrofolate--homocysteine methyltransferase
MREPLEKRLEKKVLFVDGAMGTQLFERGATAGECNEKLNLDRPDIVQSVHQAYFDAGCDAVLSNSFGGSAISLARHGLAGQARSINLAAAKIARMAAGDQRYVLGDIGPVGDFLEPLGMLKEADLFNAFAEQARALEEGGVDGFIVETMAALEEVEVAVKAVKSVSRRPVFASMAFDPAPEVARTMMGVSPQMMVDKLAPLGVCAIGFNCGTLDMEGYIALAKAFAAALKGTNIFLLAEPNAGRPELRDGKAVYTLSPQAYAEAMVKIRDAGAKIVGGCCGTSPAHLASGVKILGGCGGASPAHISETIKKAKK